MTVGIPWEEMLARLPEDRQAQIRTRAQELIAEENTRRDLRKAIGKTELALAKKLHVKQETISRAEQRTDMLLSTLDHYLHGLGGRLRLVAEFEGRAPTVLSGLSEIGCDPPRKPGRRAPPRQLAGQGRSGAAD
jgi:hypothetical protein